MPVSFLATLAPLEAEDAARVTLPFLPKAGPEVRTWPPIPPAPLAKAAFVGPPDGPLTLEPASLGPLVGPTVGPPPTTEASDAASAWPRLVPRARPHKLWPATASPPMSPGPPPRLPVMPAQATSVGPAGGPPVCDTSSSTPSPLEPPPGKTASGGSPARPPLTNTEAASAGAFAGPPVTATKAASGGLPASVAISSGAAAAAEDLATLVDDSDEEMSLGSTRTQLDFYGRPLTGPLSTASTAAVPEAPRKIYRVGLSTFIGQRHENGVRVIRYLDYGYGSDSQSM